MPTRLLPTVALIVLGAACARGHDVVPEDGVTPGQPDSVFVEVVNDNYYDARVHAIYGGGARHAIGTIAGNGRTGHTAIPWQPRALVFEVRFIIGGDTYRSEPIDAARGEVVELRLPANIEASGFFRRVAG